MNRAPKKRLLTGLLKAVKSPLCILTLALVALLFFCPRLGLCLWGLFLACLVVRPHCLPASLVDEMAVLNLMVRARLTQHRASLKQSWWHEIIPGLYLGGIPLQCHGAELQKKGIQAVYAILDDKEANLISFLGTPLRVEDWIRAEIFYARLSSPDRQLLSLEQLQQAAAWIHSQRSAGRRVYVHCKGGRERSPMAVLAYLMQYHQLSLQEAKARVLERPLVRLLYSHELRLEEFEQAIKS